MVDVVHPADLYADGPLDVLGSGGEAEVLAIAKRPGVVFKRYTQATPPDLAALEQLIELPSTMPPADRALVTERTAWPATVVADGNYVYGFLMPRLAPLFYRRHGIASNPQTVACDWNYLSRRRQFESNPLLTSDVPRLSPAQTVELVRGLVALMVVLHRHGLVIGDVSARNILWSALPSPRILLIDCDGIRPVSGGGVVTPKQSPDWDDPTLTDDQTTQASDVYKLALAAYRAVWLASSDRPPAGLATMAMPDGVPQELAQLIAESAVPSGRPTAQDWADRLTRATLLHGRPVVRMPPIAAPRPMPQPSPALLRPTISMRTCD